MLAQPINGEARAVSAIIVADARTTLQSAIGLPRDEGHPGPHFVGHTQVRPGCLCQLPKATPSTSDKRQSCPALCFLPSHTCVFKNTMLHYHDQP